MKIVFFYIISLNLRGTKPSIFIFSEGLEKKLPRFALNWLKLKMSERYKKISMHRWLIFALSGNPAQIKQDITRKIIFF